MSETLFSKAYYGNTLQEWGIAFGIIIGAVLVAKIVYWVFGSVIRKMTSKTENKLDDLIIDMIEEPIVVAITLAGFWYAVNTLTLPERLNALLGNVSHVLIALVVSWLCVRLFDSIFEQYIKPLSQKTDTDFDDQILPIIRKLVKATLWAFGIIIGLNNAGYDVAALLAGLGIGGLAFAMAAKDTVANVFGGFTILADKPFKIDDRIKISGFDGTIKEIGIRSTRLQTLDGRIVTIPNSSFADSAVENVSMEPSRKVSMELGLTYDTTPEKMKTAMTLLEKIAEANESVEDNTTVFFSAFGDSAMVVKFIYYIKKEAAIAGTQSDINMAILTEFVGAGLDFAFPTQTLYTKAV